MTRSINPMVKGFFDKKYHYTKKRVKNSIYIYRALYTYIYIYIIYF